MPVFLPGMIAKPSISSALASLAVGVVFGVNLVDGAQALRKFSGVAGRMRLVPGIKNTLIIDDTYNSAPASTHLALETLKNLPAKRRIAVLGDMLELGKYTIEAHEEMGNFAAGIADILVTSGARAKFAAYAAGNQMDQKNIYSFVNSDSAKSKVQELIEEGDLILVKGSQGMRMEKIVEEIMAEPEKKNELLVRQGKKWIKKS